MAYTVRWGLRKKVDIGSIPPDILSELREEKTLRLNRCEQILAEGEQLLAEIISSLDAASVNRGRKAMEECREEMTLLRNEINSIDIHTSVKRVARASASPR